MIYSPESEIYSFSDGWYAISYEIDDIQGLRLDFSQIIRYNKLTDKLEFREEVLTVKNRIIDEEIMLVRYYPNYKTGLAWYQDLDLCKQVDNRDTVYDLELLKRMYNYLNKHGDLFYIKYKNRLCGDVCLQPSGEINIVIAKPFQNKHIGRRVVSEIIQLAKEKDIHELRAEIYTFNTQSQKMFHSIGFKKVDDEQYILTL